MGTAACVNSQYKPAKPMHAASRRLEGEQKEFGSEANALVQLERAVTPEPTLVALLGQEVQLALGLVVVPAALLNVPRAQSAHVVPPRPTVQMGTGGREGMKGGASQGAVNLGREMQSMRL